ncbi:MAG: NADH:ubiquinone reductase (Na(+)-transporting) subunit C [Bacteroidaceae bacterium]|nr:NADH:ubiquinone reductase (Na(+)-transporting) subunit C [Bacteroidaceae bacterium]
MSKKLNTNSNLYIIIYAALMVVIVAFLLAFVSKALQKKSDANVAIDKKAQILSSLNLRDIDKDQVEAKYAEVVKQEDDSDDTPIYICKVEGQTKYVVPVSGMGLWGGIWGYVGINDDGNTVYGSYFSHQSETAGLGALIADQPFQDQFKGKKIFGNDGEVALSVVKVGKKIEGLDAQSRCDAITGATLTSDGVDQMLKACLSKYKNKLAHEAQDTTATKVIK